MTKVRVRARQLALVTPYLPRVIPLAFLVAGAAVASALVLSAQPWSLSFRVRIASALLAAGLASVLPDAAAATTGHSPTSRLALRIMRIAPCAAMVAAVWATLLVFAGTRVPPIATDAGPMTLELAALAALGLAAGAISIRAGDGPSTSSSGLVGVGVVAASSLSTYLPHPIWWPLPRSPFEPGASIRLATILAAAVAVFLAASMSPHRS